MAIAVVETSMEVSISGQELACLRAMLRIAQMRIRDAKATFPKDAAGNGKHQIAHHLEVTSSDMEDLACSDSVCTAFGAWTK